MAGDRAADPWLTSSDTATMEASIGLPGHFTKSGQEPIMSRKVIAWRDELGSDEALHARQISASEAQVDRLRGTFDNESNRDDHFAAEQPRLSYYHIGDFARHRIKYDMNYVAARAIGALHRRIDWNIHFDCLSAPAPVSTAQEVAHTWYPAAGRSVFTLALQAA